MNRMGEVVEGHLHLLSVGSELPLRLRRPIELVLGHIGCSSPRALEDGLWIIQHVDIHVGHVWVRLVLQILLDEHSLQVESLHVLVLLFKGLFEVF